jgi:hypothetical protein
VERTRAWLAVSPLVATGVLAGHALAYRLTGTPTGSLHEYLDHAPQVLFVLAVVGLAVVGLAARLPVPSTWPFPVAALATFVLQEHVERVAHDGQLPWLLGSPVFMVGLLLQVPFALVAWMLARCLLAPLAKPMPTRPHVAYQLLRLTRLTSPDVRPVPAAPLPGRGPPLLHRR